MAQPFRNRGVLAALTFTLAFAFPALAQGKPEEPKEAIKEVVKEEPKKEAEPQKKEAVKEEPKAQEPKKEEPKKEEAKAEEPKKVEPKEEPKKVEPPAPATHLVKKESFKIDLTLNGVFEARQIVEIPLRPEVWQQFVVSKVVEHGSLVKKGEIILQFDPKVIDDAIRDIEASRALGDLEYQAAQEQLSMLEETIPMDIEAAERTKQYFDEDVKRYYEIELPLVRRMADENLKSAQNILDYQMEELRQLEKMYKADDLVEETEEIILKRQRDTVARLQFNLERAKLQHDQMLGISIPREETQVKRNEKLSDLRIRSARSNFPRMLIQQRLTLQKITRDREKSLEQLNKLKKDRASMSVTAPIDGIVYYGQHTRGQWNGVGPLSQMLQDGAGVKPGMVLMSVVNPRPMVLRTTVAEAALSLAKPGITGSASPVGFSEQKLTARLESVGLAPLAPGQFDAVVSVTLDADARVVPGMAASIKLLAHHNENAITLPANLVHAEEDDDRKFVYVLTSGNKHRKQMVKIGRTNNNKTEILDGLKEGDKVLVNKPN